ncbi:MAG: hypothetical protein M0Z46_13830 [Actinomycetota bacterium]|nr:hypothetical protein [Actinomycetota bacterium]
MAIAVGLTVSLVAGGAAVAGALSSPVRASHAARGFGGADRRSATLPMKVAVGQVTGVDGVSTPGHCGTAGKTGTFVVENLRRSSSTTVDVSATTRFLAPTTLGASFADVCVGSTVFVQGTTASGTVSATRVIVVPLGRFRPQGDQQFPQGDRHFSGSAASWLGLGHSFAGTTTPRTTTRGSFSSL